MRAHHPRRSGFAWPELLLVLAFLVMFFQLFPALWLNTIWALDIRNWSRTAWMCANVVIVLGLIGFRVGPGLVDEWQRRRVRLKTERARQTKQLQLKEQRELFERMRQARKRQVY